MNGFSSLKILSITQTEGPEKDFPRFEARIELLDSEGNKLSEKTVPYFDSKLIFEYLRKKSDLDLQNALVVDFDLDRYREQAGLPAHKFVTVKNFRADNAIFLSDEKVSFRRSNFIGDDASFAKATFIAPEVSFEEANFEKTEANFHAVVFRSERLIFSGAKFGIQHHDFRNARFSGVKLMENMVFRGGEVDFVGVDFGEGDISFANTSFGDSRVLFRMSIFGKGKKDFSRVNFGNGDVSFEKVEFGDGDVNFRSTVFGNGKKDFRRCSFGTGKKNFANADFGDGTVEFVSTDFGKGKVIFKLARFGFGTKDFHYSHFGDGDIQFDKTVFGEGMVDFRAVDFDNCRIIFNHIEISSGDLVFEASQMKSGFLNLKNSLLGRGECNFKNIVYENADIIVENVDFGLGTISFYLARVQNLIFKSSQINNYFDLRVSYCEYVDLSDTVIKDIVDMQMHSSRMEIKHLDLRGVRLLGRIYADWEGLKLKQLILQQDSTWNEKAEQFRMLKENFHNLGRYEEEDLAYVEFKRAEALTILERRKKGDWYSRLIAYPVHWSKVLVMDKMGHYATNPIRVLTSMLIVYLVFTLAYLILETVSPEPQIVSSLFPPGDPQILGKVARAFYHSAITFLTIGYGDYYPNGISRWISAVEGFIGLFMMSYFTVAFVRKILR